MQAKEKIARKIMGMKKYVDFLRSCAAIPRERLHEDYILKSAVERNFQLAIESALDIGEIIISAESLEKPEDYRSVFLILGRHGVISPGFAERLAKAAGFRNILVHAYEEVDVDRLYDYLQNSLRDFDEFARSVAIYLKKASFD